MSKRIISGMATTNATDRSGDVIDPAGAFYTLPFPLLYAHDPKQIIGQVTAIQRLDNGLLATAEIVPDGTTVMADETWGLIKAGVLKGLSIGFLPVDLDVMAAGISYTRYEIYELSVVAIPCNAAATIWVSTNEVKSVAPTASVRPGPQIDLTHSRYSVADAPVKPREKLDLSFSIHSMPR